MTGISKSSLKIEHIVSGKVVGTPKLHGDGAYRCFFEGTNMRPKKPITLEGVEKFLRANPRGGVRMAPSGSRIVEDIYINGVPR